MVNIFAIFLKITEIYRKSHLMRKLMLLFAILCLFCPIVFAQSINQIKEDPDYIWGEGTGSSERIADKEALEQLSQQISITIASDTRMKITNEQHDADDVKSDIVFEKVMNTYSTATLSNTHRMVVENGPTVYRVFRYVKKTEVDRIFSSRKEKVKEFVKIANRSLEQLQINDALRYYYWASVLTQSLRYPNEAVVTDESGSEYKAMIWIPKRINEIFGDLSMDILNQKGNEYEVGFFYKEKPVATLDFTYFDGSNWSCVNTATDGKGFIEFRPSYVPEYFQVRYEYEYYGEAQCDTEVKSVMDAVLSSAVYPRAQVRIAAKKRINKQSIEFTNLSALENKIPELETDSRATVAEKCNDVMQKVISAIRSKNYSSVNTLFTDEGYDVFTRLINYGKGRIVGEPKLSYSTLNGDIYCRSVPMNFVFSRNRRFVEDVVFVFNNVGLIDNVSFSLGKVATNDILGNAGSWSVEAKNVLVNFLETYKTAYALKRIDYLNSIFADDALIITGKVVTKSMRMQDGLYTNNRYIKLNKQTKDQYIRNLCKMFKSREYVNIKFANNEVKKMGKGGEVYSIQIKQDFFSSTYGDSGYLFILVDLNKPDEPTIRVRAWQEFPDPEWGKYGPEMF